MAGGADPHADYTTQCAGLRARIAAVETYNGQLADTYAVLAARLQRLAYERMLVAAAVRELARAADTLPDFPTPPPPASAPSTTLTPRALAVVDALRASAPLPPHKVAEAAADHTDVDGAHDTPHSPRLALDDAAVRLLVAAAVADLAPMDHTHPRDAIRELLAHVAPGLVADPETAASAAAAIRAIVPSAIRLAASTDSSSDAPADETVDSKDVVEDNDPVPVLSQFFETSTSMRIASLAGRIFGTIPVAPPPSQSVSSSGAQQPAGHQMLQNQLATAAAAVQQSAARHGYDFSLAGPAAHLPAEMHGALSPQVASFYDKQHDQNAADALRALGGVASPQFSADNAASALHVLAGAGAALESGAMAVDGKEEKTPAKRRKRVRDPNAPKRPANAFMMWSESERDRIKQMRDKMTEKEVEFAGLNNLTKALGARWQQLDASQKKIWFERSEAEMQRYDDAMADYVQQMGGENAAELASRLPRRSAQRLKQRQEAAAARELADSTTGGTATPVEPATPHPVAAMEDDDEDGEDGDGDGDGEDGGQQDAAPSQSSAR